MVKLFDIDAPSIFSGVLDDCGQDGDQLVRLTRQAHEPLWWHDAGGREKAQPVVGFPGLFARNV